MTTAANEHTHQASPTQGPGRGTAADPPHPQVALLSNGSYGVMITDAGAGASTWRDLDVTRWREDATRDCWGQFVYVRCPEDGRIWSIGHQPMPRGVDEYQVAFHADRAEFRRRDGDVETCCAICVARDHDAEVRLVTLVNHGGRARELDLTSYAEVCLNYRRADQGHTGLREAVSRDRVRPWSGCAAGPPQAAGRGRKACLGHPRYSGGRPSQWRGGIRD
jgi:cellobiose phosphorylase